MQKLNNIHNSSLVVMNFMQVDRLHHTCVDVKINSMGFGIHRAQHGMLMFLNSQGENVSQKDIADFFKISPAAVANAMKSLESGGFIKRKPDKTDTRRNIVKITEKGKDVIDKSSEIFSSIDKAMIKGLSDEELGIFRKCLDTMAENLKEEINGKEE